LCVSQRAASCGFATAAVAADASPEDASEARGATLVEPVVPVVCLYLEGLRQNG